MGKHSGEGFVHLDSEGDVEKAMAHNKEYLKSRYVLIEEIYEFQYKNETNGCERNFATAPTTIATVPIPRMFQPNSDAFLKIRGLPEEATAEDIKKFLDDCRIIDDIFIVTNEAGRRNGEAVMKLLTRTDIEKAIKKKTMKLKEKFIGLEETDIDTYYKHVKKTARLENEDNTFIRMKGLVWSATIEDIRSFLHDSNIKEIILTTNDRGKPSGEAFVSLETEDDVEMAMSHNKEFLQKRYVIMEEIYEAQYLKAKQGLGGRSGQIRTFADEVYEPDSKRIKML